MNLSKHGSTRNNKANKTIVNVFELNRFVTIPIRISQILLNVNGFRLYSALGLIFARLFTDFCSLPVSTNAGAVNYLNEYYIHSYIVRLVLVPVNCASTVHVLFESMYFVYLYSTFCNRSYSYSNAYESFTNESIISHPIHSFICWCIKR